MSAIKTKSKLQSRKNSRDEKPKITNISNQKNTTYKINPKSFRMTENDIRKLESLTSQIIKTTGASCTVSKTIRGLIHLSDKIELKDIIISISSNT